MNFFATLSRYASRSFLASFIGVLAALFVIVCAFDFAELQRRVAVKIDINYLVKLKMVILKAPYIIEQVFPFIVFLAALYVFWKMNRNHELVVTRAAGISVWQLVLPVMCTAWIIGALDLFVINEFTAGLMSREIKMEDHYLGRHRSGMKLSKSGLWLRENYDDHYQAIYRMDRVDIPKRELRNLTVYQYLDQNKFTGRLDAHSATLQPDRLLLRDVWRVEKGKPPKHFSSLEIPTSLTPDSIQNTGIHQSTLSFWNLPPYLDLLKTSGLSTTKYGMYYHSMVSRAIWLGMMVLLAAAFTFRPVRSGKTTLLIMSGLFSGFMLYFLRDFTYALGASGSMSTFLAAALPPLLTGVVGATLLLYQEDG